LTDLGEVHDQHDEWARYAAINYDVNDGQFVFSARRWNSTTSSYICQLQQGPLYDANNYTMSLKYWPDLDRFE